MKLNTDCIRDVLIYLEDNLVMNQYNNIQEISINKIATDLSNNYNEKDIIYTLLQLISEQFIIGHIRPIGKNSKISGYVKDISWAGHDLLNSIRPQPVWNAIKQNASNLGIKSIKGLASLAGNVINAIATNPDVINQIIANIK